jgi:aminomethyltransferase
MDGDECLERHGQSSSVAPGPESIVRLRLTRRHSAKNTLECSAARARRLEILRDVNGGLPHAIHRTIHENTPSISLSAQHFDRPARNVHNCAVAGRTPLYEAHVAAGARMVEFSGWDMPLHYGSQLEEHHAVRRDAGMFDVSHMLIVDVRGARAREFLRHVLANDVARLRQPDQALYSCMLNDTGGVVDDLIVYFIADERFRLVVNASNRDKDVAWLERHAGSFAVKIRRRTDLAMIAVQGPNARAKASARLGARAADALALKSLHGREIDRFFIARTGYTGEDGWEIMLPEAEAAGLWAGLREAGVAPCGLGARDTLRLEAGMMLYGQDLDEAHSPLESGLAWTVAFDPRERDFVGRAALEAQRRGGEGRRLVGLVLDGRGVLRGHQTVRAGAAGEGEITSGTFSPTLERAIALARVPAGTGDRVEVDIRGRRLPARVVKFPFVRHGKALIWLGSRMNALPQ